MKARYTLLLATLMVSLVALSYEFYQRTLSKQFVLSDVFVQTSVIVLFSFLVLLVLRYLTLIWFSYLDQLEDEELPDLKRYPRVSVLVPCYNEGTVVQASIRSLLDLDYPNFEILVIDDGSTDDTYRKANAGSPQLGYHRGHMCMKIIAFRLGAAADR